VNAEPHRSPRESDVCRQIERIARELGGSTAYRAGRGSWLTLCPIHPDSSPSLHVSIGRDEKVLCHCFAGCTWRGVRDELIARGLLPDRRRAREIPTRLIGWRVARDAEVALRQGELSAREFVVLLIHIRFAMRSREEEHFASVRTIEEMTPLSRSAASRIHQRLKKEGWLIPGHRPTGKAAVWQLAPPRRRSKRDTAYSKGVPLTYLCPELFAILVHDVWRLSGASSACNALVYMLLKEPRTSREISDLVGAPLRVVQQRLHWLKKCGLVEHNNRSWMRTDCDLDSAAQFVGTLGEGERLRQKHVEERMTYHFQLLSLRQPRRPLGATRLKSTEDDEMDRLARADGWVGNRR
jgi:DNA-binding IscR family transcriptional regulator